MSQLFHEVMNGISHDSLFVGLAASGSTDDVISDLVKPALNGPVTTSISILLGTLVATTITIAVDRNRDVHKIMSIMVEEVRLSQLLVDSFSEPYRSEVQQLLSSFMSEANVS
jgi:hypothetical protein